jgi:hypothetical protein
MDIFTLLIDNVPGLRVDLLDRAGSSPADYAVLMDRADLLEALLTRGSPVALRDGENTVVLPTLAFLGRIKATSAPFRFQLPISSALSNDSHVRIGDARGLRGG